MRTKSLLKKRYYGSEQGQRVAQPLQIGKYKNLGTFLGYTTVVRKVPGVNSFEAECQRRQRQTLHSDTRDNSPELHNDYKYMHTQHQNT